MSQSHRRHVFALVGPTASGKTEISLALADRFDLTLISVDSAMIYRGLDIGTAKPSAEQQLRYPHELIDIVDPEEDYSVGEFVHAADQAVERAFQRSRIPLLIGGTMMYLKGFREGIASLPPRSKEFREQLQKRVDLVGTSGLHNELSEVDSEAARRIHPNNYSRIERALEIFHLTGQPLSQVLNNFPGVAIERRLDCTYHEIALLTHSRSELHNRIESRVRQMIDDGFVEEVAELMRRPGLNSSSMSMRSVGYRQMWRHLEQELAERDIAATADVIAAATRQVARRQLTWLRSWRNDKRHIAVVDQDPADTLERLFLESQGN